MVRLAFAAIIALSVNALGFAGASNEPKMDLLKDKIKQPAAKRPKAYDRMLSTIEQIKGDLRFRFGPLTLGGKKLNWEKYLDKSNRFVHISTQYETARQALENCWRKYFPEQLLKGEPITVSKLPKEGKKVALKIINAAAGMNLGRPKTFIGACFVTSPDYTLRTGLEYIPFRYIAYAESESYFEAAEGVESDDGD